MKFSSNVESIDRVIYANREAVQVVGTRDGVRQMFWMRDHKGGKECVHITYLDGREKLVYDIDEVVATRNA